MFISLRTQSPAGNWERWNNFWIINCFFSRHQHCLSFLFYFECIEQNFRNWISMHSIKILNCIAIAINMHRWIFSFSGPWEILLAVTVLGYTINEIYQLFRINTPKFYTKLKRYVSSPWNMLDLVCIFIFVLAFVFRFIRKTLMVCNLIFYRVFFSRIPLFSILE